MRLELALQHLSGETSVHVVDGCDVPAGCVELRALKRTPRAHLQIELHMTPDEARAVRRALKQAIREVEARTHNGG